MQPARGLALIGALAVVAVATALGYEIIARHALSVSQSRQTLGGAQADSSPPLASPASWALHSSTTSASAGWCPEDDHVWRRQQEQ